MPLCYCPKNSISEMVSSSRSRTTGKEVKWTTIKGQEEERDSKGEVYKKQEIFEPYTYFS
jgi:hypothetical protein